LAGTAIFFDDYANTLIVGNTMRPVTDRLRVSREKLAYIVDSTAAPIAAIALISTWVGFEISLIGDSLRTASTLVADPAQQADLLAASQNPFNVFLHSIPYLFYPILTLLFVLMVVVTRRDFGPMLEAERRAATGGGLIRPGAMPAADTSGGALEPPEGVVPRWYNAALPVLTVVVVALLRIYWGRLLGAPGSQASLRVFVGGAVLCKAMLWASLGDCMVAIGLTVALRVLMPSEGNEA